ncbi:Hpt domain-containing protein [Sphingomonas sp. HF-S3]|uniref:Hpt domain-containing protein n=1 Tax=Sphingomonas rustica TaxID=3103142 RepID=A0ABV0B9L1_9SPHN
MTSFEERLGAIRLRFIEQAGLDADAIERSLDEGAWKSVRDLGHGIAGRAGMFGFDDLTDSARQLERAIDGAQPTDHLHALARALIADLRGLPRPD